MAGLGTIGYGMTAVLIEGGIKTVFWALDERRKKLTRREIETLTEARPDEQGKGQLCHRRAVQDD